MKKCIVMLFVVVLLFAFCEVSYAYKLYSDIQKLSDVHKLSSDERILSIDLPNQKGMKIGQSNARFHAAMKTSVMYEDNIYLSKDDRKKDWITVLEPMFALIAPFGKNRFVAEYKFSEYLYSKYHREDHPDHLARGLVEINLTDYQLKLEERYQRFTNRASIEDSARIRQQNNKFRAGISTINENKFGFDIGYTNKIEDYLSNEIVTGIMTYDDKDRMYHIIDLQLLYQVAPKTILILETDLGWIDYDSKLNPDSFYVEPLIGLRGEITNKITANIKGGYRVQNYKESQLVISDDFDSFVMGGGVDFQASKDDIINISLERSSYESTYKNINYYEGTFGKLTYTHNFSDKLSVSPYGNYQLNRYPEETTEGTETKKRRDKLFGGGVSLRYNMQDWISIQATYDYSERDSNFNNLDYKDNVYMASVMIGF